MIPTPASLEGKPVPKVTFKARPDDQWRDITHRRAVQGQDRGRVLPARRLHAHLFVDPPAPL